MKKIITFIILGLSTCISAQSFSVYKTNNLGTNTETITNGYSLIETSSPSTLINTKIKIKNNAATTQTFNVIRSIVAQNPVLFLDNSANTPSSYFCFGYTCYSSAVNTAPSTDYTILSASGSTSTTFPFADNSYANSQPFSIYLDEGTAPGYYVIKYKVFNVANANDTLSFKVIYNQTLGVKENKNSLDFLCDIYPNPSKDETSLKINAISATKANVVIVNSLGQTICTKKIDLSSGTNLVELDTKNYASGLYSVIVETNNQKVIKKLIVTK